MTQPHNPNDAEPHDPPHAKAEQAGADAYIVKPFNAEALSEKIAAVMGR